MGWFEGFSVAALLLALAAPVWAGAFADGDRASRLSMLLPAERMARIGADLRAALAHLAVWSVPLLVTVVGPMWVTDKWSFREVALAQHDLWLLAALPVAFAAYVGAAGIGLGSAPTVAAVPRRARKAMRVLVAATLAWPAAHLYLGARPAETHADLALLLLKSLAVGAIIYRLSGLSRPVSPTAARWLSPTLAALALANVSVVVLAHWAD